MGFQIHITSMICLVTHILYSCTNINTNCLQTQVWISLYQDVKIVVPILPCDPHFCTHAQISRQIVYKPKFGSLFMVTGMTNVKFHTLPLRAWYINSENHHSYNFPSIIFTHKPTPLTSLLTNIHLMKHNKRQYKPPLKWGDLYIRLNPSVNYLQGSPYFGSQREYQFIALISLVDAFYSNIKVEIEICPDPLPHAASFLNLVCRSFQRSGIRLTLAECFHLNCFVVSLSGEHWNLSKTLGGYGI
jgi:hypothetical protein